MKLAEALQERADLNQRISNLYQRLNANLLVQEGETPAEDPDKLMKEYMADADRLEYITSKINETNCKTVVDGKTLTELLSRRDVLRQTLLHYRSLINNCSQMSVQRSRGSEIKILRTVDVRAMQKRTDELAHELRELENKVQAANWTTELCE